MSIVFTDFDQLGVNPNVAEILDELKPIVERVLSEDSEVSWDIALALLIQVASIAKLKELDRDYLISTLWMMTIPTDEYFSKSEVTKH
jgi:small-conductance mechanosensitive channel|tara:strand:+ start:312 stop:575 length:264 start_codon:yes stop_codon:yes gene_type:complete